MSKEEKTVVFWIGLVVFGYAIVNFCVAVWQAIYSYYYYNAFYSTISSFSGVEILFIAQAIVPSIISGIIFMIIGLYIMKVGSRKKPDSDKKQN